MCDNLLLFCEKMYKIYLLCFLEICDAGIKQDFEVDFRASNEVFFVLISKLKKIIFTL